MAKIVYWRRELPPLSEQLEGEHEVASSSPRVHYEWAAPDAHWSACHAELLACARERITQEVARLGGSCAHVVDEVVRARRDEATQEFWLEGTFTFLLYRHPEPPPAAPPTP
jgi:hypothetical protein